MIILKAHFATLLRALTVCPKLETRVPGVCSVRQFRNKKFYVWTAAVGISNLRETGLSNLKINVGSPTPSDIVDVFWDNESTQDDRK